MPHPTFEMLVMRLFTDSDFIDQFTNGGSDRERALQSIGFDPSDPNYKSIIDALNNIDYASIKTAIQALPHSSILEALLLKPAN
jgi:hypothetical protein